MKITRQEIIFKIVYKRHTNFSIESIPQFFNIQPDFSTKVSCIISKNAYKLTNWWDNIHVLT